jgi:heme-degrading monooxygenase HmoA
VIVERAQIDVERGREAEFEAALAEARLVLDEARGFRGISVARGIESPSRYLLLLEWERLEDHTEAFRGGALYVRWRELIGPFFAQPPAVEHFQPL